MNSSLDIEKYTVTLSPNEIIMLIKAINNNDIEQDRHYNDDALQTAYNKLAKARDQADKDIRQRFEDWLNEDDNESN